MGQWREKLCTGFYNKKGKNIGYKRSTKMNSMVDGKERHIRYWKIKLGTALFSLKGEIVFARKYYQVCYILY